MSLMFITANLDDVDVLKKLSSNLRMMPKVIRSPNDFELTDSVSEVILCDPLVWTELDISAAFKLVKNKYPHSILIAVLERDASVNYDELLNCGVNEFIRRPIDDKILSARIQSQIRQSELSKVASESGRIVHLLLKATVHDLGNLIALVQLRLRKVMRTSIGKDPDLSLMQARIDDAVSMLKRVQKTYLQMNVCDDRTLFEYKPVIPAIEKSIEFANELFNKKSIQFVLNSQIEQGLQIPMIEDLLIFQILINFLTNAVKFSSPESSVFISVQKIEHMIEIGIRDTGIGIEPRLREKIAKKIAVRSSDGTSGEKGLGLGLSIASEFIERIGGKLSLESKTVAEDSNKHGTLFKICLPIDFPAST